MRIVHVMNRFFNAVAVSVSALTMVSCGKDDPGAPEDGNAIRVLFIGNSLTYTNDLPHMVQDLAEASGESIVAQSIALPNYALIDHWKEGVAQETIRSGGFDFVVLQQGPSSLAINRDSLRLVTAMFDGVIRQSGARTALFAVWPELERFSVFPVVAESYFLAAQDVGGMYLPVGNTWLYTFNTRQDAPLYGPDGYHPGVAGTYAAAVVMVSMFTSRDPESLSLDVPGLDLDKSLMTIIQTAARSAIAGPSVLSR